MGLISRKSKSIKPLSTEPIEKNTVKVSTETTEKQLPDVYALNTKGRAGNLSTFTPYPGLGFLSDYNEQTGQTQSFVYSTMMVFQNWHTSKYKYTCKKTFDFKLMERLVFWMGAVIVFPWKGGYATTTFTVEKFDEFYYPVIVKPIFPNSKIETKSLEIGKDCVLLMGGYNTFFTTTIFMYGLGYSLWYRVQELARIHKEINSNFTINNQKLVYFKTDSSDNGAKEIETVLNSPDLVVEIDVNSLDVQAMKGLISGDKSKIGGLGLEDRFPSLESQFNFNLNLMKMIAGARVNSAEKKKERLITTEVSSNNQVTSSIIDNEFDFRKKFVEDMKTVFNEDITVEISSNFVEDIQGFDVLSKDESEEQENDK